MKPFLYILKIQLFIFPKFSLIFLDFNGLITFYWSKSMSKQLNS